MNKRQQSAYKSILKSGRMTEFVRRVTVEDDLTGEIITQDEVQTLPCVALPDDEVMSDGVQAGSLVSQKSRKCIAAAGGATFNLQSGDTMKWTDGDWTILGATPLDPAGDGIIMWQFGVSR